MIEQEILDIMELHAPREDHNGCWIWQGRFTTRGVPEIHTKVNGRNIYRKVYRAMWELHYGEIPQGRTVYRICGNTKCVAPYHLGIGGEYHKQAAKANPAAEIRKQIEEDFPCDGTEFHDAMLFCIALAFVGGDDQITLTNYTGLDAEQVEVFLERAIENEMWKDGHVCANWIEEEGDVAGEGVTALILDSMAIMGKLVRVD